MNRQFQLTGLLCFLLILYFPLSFAQDGESNEETEPKDVDVPSGQEVEINEDNYRQFMELRDARGQRNMLPENAFKAGSGAQKLDKLPEESQKHLRNQLREIIVQGDQWQPGDEAGEHPYVPSAAAGADASLAKQEAEAWGELVENYHQREAQIYENSARSQAAMANGASSGSSPGNGEGSKGGAGQGGEGQESSQPTQGEQGGAADSYSPNAQNDPNATSTQGVSQNAMEFLSGKGSQVAQAGETNNGETTEGETTEGAGESAQNDSQGGEQAQQGSESQDQPGNNSAESSTASATAELENQRTTTGASQNALEYLTGGQEQTSQASGNSPGDEGIDETMPMPGSMQGTLNIQDLINAQGVGNTPGTGSPIPGGNSGTPPDKDPDKDTDG